MIHLLPLTELQRVRPVFAYKQSFHTRIIPYHRGGNQSGKILTDQLKSKTGLLVVTRKPIISALRSISGDNVAKFILQLARNERAGQHENDSTKELHQKPGPFTTQLESRPKYTTCYQGQSWKHIHSPSPASSSKEHGTRPTGAAPCPHA